VGLDVLKAAARCLAECCECAYLILNERFRLGGRDVHISSAEADKIRKAGMRADRDAVCVRERYGLLHHERIGRMEAAGYIGGRNIFYDLIVETQLIVAEALAEVAVKIYFVHIRTPCQYLSSTFLTSVISICPGEWVIAMGGFVLMSADCGVTPHGQNTGTSPGFIVTESPKSGFEISSMPITDGSPICIGAP
jgi:hypothetical protein